MKDLSLKDKLSTKETEDISCHGDDISANGYFDLLPYEVNIHTLDNLHSRCKYLQRLNLSWCDGTSSVLQNQNFRRADLRSRTGFLVNLVENCPKLKKIFLTANRSICDEDLLAVAQYCKDLEQIDILGTRQVSKESVYKVLKNCTKLIFFDLSFCEKIDFETYFLNNY
ncbi:hypothetical protein KUTeg_008304 [Tegillarca granosa]|uniref:Uncharacterized protein n=1 Tax=Tegillarca granosa TaxID=220873 RepID=A0ABQ9F8R2_TEGGR|nr:hypothetical protein KUTeg_008304 [Tegillarca granosa]